MNTLVLLFIGLFAISVLIVAKIVINTHKRRREADEEEQRRRAELEALAFNLKTQEDRISSQKQELTAKEDSLKKEAEALIREREDVATIRKELNTEAERIAEAHAMLDAKSEQLAVFEENLKKTNEKLEEKDLKLTALKEELEGRAASLFKEKERLDDRDAELKALQSELESERREMEYKVAAITEEERNLLAERTTLKSARENTDELVTKLYAHAHDLKAIEDKIRVQKQELAAKEDALKKDAEALIREREDVAAIRKGLNTDAEKIAEAHAMLDTTIQEHLAKKKELLDINAELQARSEQLAAFEEKLEKTSEELAAKDLKLIALNEEIDVRAAALMREKEELDARDAELKALRDELKSKREEIEHKIAEIIEEKENLAEEYAALKKNAHEKLEKLVQLEAELELCEEERQKAETEDSGGRRLPHERGGRPRGSTEEAEIRQGQETKRRSLNPPEIVCWKEGWSWIIGIEVPEELESVHVTQKEEILEQEKSDELRYRLKHANGIAKVSWTEGFKELSLMGPKRNYLIFKMRKNWKEPGRLVQRSSIGHYLVIIPQEWQRDKEVSGSAPVMPESIHLEGYTAHFFYREQKGNKAISFITMNGERIRADSISPRFQLIGNEINDASEDMGTLFGGEPPLIKVLDEKGWGNIGIIVVGEEGRGRNRWRTQFTPRVDTREQKLSEEMIHRRGGWYFVRIYDNDYNLIESMDFRFLTALKDIHIESSGCLPDPTGYDSFTCRFLHQTDCKVEPMDEDIRHLLEIRRETSQTIVTIAPKPECDETHWILHDVNAEIKVTVLAERLWWALGVLTTAPTNWFDKPLILSPKDFTAITDKTLWVRFPRLLFVRKIDAGFNRSKSRSYQIEVGKEKLAIPLRDFCDAEEILNPRHECIFQFFIHSQDKTYSAPVLQLNILFHCKYCEFITSSEQEAKSHLVSHLSDLIPHLSYEELRQKFSESLPHEIYKCGYCNFYVSSDDPKNPTSTICSHIESKCNKVRRGNGIVKISFSVVSDIDEIRENVIADLPRIFQCRICGKEFQGDNIELRKSHLQENHENEIIVIS